MKRIGTLLLALAFCIPAFSQAANSNPDNKKGGDGTEQCACLSPADQKERSPLGENPYWVFIGFLYACVAADIAGRFARVSYEWKKYEHSTRSVPVYSHLVLASFVVGTSWMAWSQAFAIRHVSAPKEVISAEALLVIVDFTILVMYFGFVMVVGNERESGELIDAKSAARKHPSYWIALILTVYVVWDLFAYLFVPLSNRSTKCPHCFWNHSWMSLLCAGLAWLAFRGLRRVRSDRLRWMLAGDGSMLSLLIF